MDPQTFLHAYGYLKYVRQDKLVTFVWEGGQYIDVFWSDHQAIWGNFGSRPFETINVLGGDGEPTVGPDTWRNACDVWLFDHEADLPGYLRDWAGL